MRSVPRTVVCRRGGGLAEIRQRGERAVGQRQQGGAVARERHALRRAGEELQPGGLGQAS